MQHVENRFLSKIWAMGPSENRDCALLIYICIFDRLHLNVDLAYSVCSVNICFSFLKHMNESANINIPFFSGLAKPWLKTKHGDSYWTHFSPRAKPWPEQVFLLAFLSETAKYIRLAAGAGFSLIYLIRVSSSLGRRIHCFVLEIGKKKKKES